MVYEVLDVFTQNGKFKDIPQTEQYIVEMNEAYNQMVYEGIDVGTASKDTPTDVTDMLINPDFQQVFEEKDSVAFTDAAGAAAFATYVRAVLLRDEGPCISPFNAWILLQGVETLSLRLDRHVENTKRVVEYLASSPYVAKVNHPSLPDHSDHELYKRYFPRGGASIFTFEIKGGQDAAWKFIDHLQVFSLLANVADVKSLVIHPATTTHSQLTERSSPTRHHARDHSPFHRYGGHRRHHLGLGSTFTAL